MRIGNEVRSHARAAASKVAAAALAMTLAVGLAPQFVQSGYAETPGENRGGGLYSSVASEAPADSLSDQAQETEGENEADAAGTAGAPLAAALVAGTQTSVVRGDVALTALDAEAQAVVGSFTADGLTFAIDAAGQVALVAVAPTEGSHSDADTEGASAEAAEDATLHLPAAVSHDGIDYALVRIAPLALDGAGITAVSIPDTVSAIDPSAALGCELLAAVAVSEANPFFAAFDGYLTDKALTSILLVPEGRIGQIRIPSTMATIDPRAFSHCARIDALVVDADCPGLASWDGSLYTKDLTELLRVPAGATELALPPECAAIGPSALSGCTDLRSIDARGTVASIAPSAFGEIEEVEALPAAAVSSADEAAAPERPAQVTGLVAVASNALSSVQVDKAAISVTVPEGSDASAWEAAGFAVKPVSVGNASTPVEVTLQSAAAHDANLTAHFNANGGTFTVMRCANYSIVDGVESGDWEILAGSAPEWNAVYDSNNTAVFGCDVNFGAGWWIWENGGAVLYRCTCAGRLGYTLTGVGGSVNLSVPVYDYPISAGSTYIALWRPNAYTISLDAQGGTVSQASIAATYDQDATLPEAARAGYKFLGWNTAVDGSGGAYQPGTVRNLTADDGATVALYAQWERIDYALGFDVDSEPGDADYPGDAMGDQSANIDSGQVAIEDPKRPGYVFEGWVIPTEDGTEAIDQNLVYQGGDGKWYVDASKLPDYAGDDGRVELTARWTSVISVDVPSSVTFYADLVTQGQQSREGAASSAFGQSKVSNQSQVDLRVVGLESSAVKTEGTTLGADSILKKADAATPSTSTQKLLSLYPSAKAWTADELRDPDAVGGSKATTAVDFDLDDILLEKSFAADDFTIAAGDTLNMGYRLNLSETGQQLDYDKLSALEDGQSAAIANVSYCFSSEGPPVFWTYDEGGQMMSLPRIKADAEKISGGDAGTTERYTRWMNDDHRFYLRWFDKGITEASARPESDSTVYEVRLLGVNHDDKADGTGKAGLTFQFVDCLDTAYAMSDSSSTGGGWPSSKLWSMLNAASGELYQEAPMDMLSAIELVRKQSGTSWGSSTMVTTNDSFFLLSMREIWGQSTGSWTEGSRYPYYESAFFLTRPTPGGQPLLMKNREGSSSGWWLRTIGSTTFYKALGSIGACELDGEYGSTVPYLRTGVSPAFCL